MFPDAKQYQRHIYFVSLCGKVVLAATLLFMINPVIYENNRIYSDCNDVLAKQQPNGPYAIYQDSGLQKTIYCQDGFALIQRTNPNAGNRLDYFRRRLTDYQSGFGYTSREYWAGLYTIVRLNDLGNNALLLRGHSHSNRIFTAVFPNVRIVRNITDEDDYFQRTKYNHKQMKVNEYVLRSITNNAFIFLPPNYVKPYDDKDEKLESGYFNEDKHFASFTSYDSQENQCSSHFNSTGWWFPIQLSRAGYKPTCVLDSAKSGLATNLNGMHNKNKDKNQRVIAFCNRNGKQCFERIERQRSSVTGQFEETTESGKYKFNGEVIDLVSTEIYLLRGSTAGNYKNNLIGCMCYKL